MLVWEKEYNKSKKRLRFLLFVLVLLLIVQLIYSLVVSKNYFVFTDRYKKDTKGFDLQNPSEVIVNFDYSFLDSKKYLLLVDRAYSLPVDVSVGRNNPFVPYNK